MFELVSVDIIVITMCGSIMLGQAVGLVPALDVLLVCGGPGVQGGTSGTNVVGWHSLCVGGAVLAGCLVDSLGSSAVCGVIY